MDTVHEKQRMMKYSVMFISLSCLCLFIPMWLALLILSIIVFFSITGTGYQLFSVVLLIILSALFNSGVDITGDLVAYSQIFNNLDKLSYIQEYTSEPLLLYFYEACNYIGMGFSDALFVQSLLVNLLLCYLICCYFGSKALKYIPVILLYPQFIQQGLFLSRQALSTVFFMALIAQLRCKPFFYFKSLFFSALSLLAHSISIIHITIYVFARYIRVYVRWYTVISVVLIAIFFPLNESFITHSLSNFMNVSGSLDRKIGFYMNNGGDTMVLNLFSMLLLPLHFTFILISSVLIKIKKSNVKIDSLTIVFLSLYFLILILRNYSLLPTRLGMPVIIFPAMFFYNVTTRYAEYIKGRRIYEMIFFAFVCMAFLRFLYTNDYGDYAITILGKESFLASPLYYLLEL